MGKKGMSNQLVYKGHSIHLNKNSLRVWEEVTKIYSKKGLAVNNSPSKYENDNYKVECEIVEYELVPTGRKFNDKGVLID
jgi:hypothetical protein